MDLFQIIAWLWTNGLVIPMTNFLVLISRLSLGNFGVAIIVFTLIMRGLTWPLTQQQLRSTRAMQAIQPRVQEIQKKYKDPKRRSEETMKLYREAGVNPLGCLWPMLVQFPIWIALYQAIRITLGATPESLLSLSQRLYPWSFLRTAIPLENHFLWMDLGVPDPLVMPILVGVSTWVQQRMTTPASASTDPQQQATQNTMLWLMPLMFAFFTLQFPSGLALYWLATNLVSIGLQTLYMGPGNVNWRRIFSLSPAPAPAAQSPKRDGQTETADGELQEVEAEVVSASSRRRRRRRRGRRRR